MASDEYQLENDDPETLPMASDEYQQEPPLPPPPSPPSEDDRDGMTVLERFIRLVGTANDLRPRIEGLLAMFSDIRFWEECIRDQNTEERDQPEPPDEELLGRFRGVDSRISEAIARLPRLAEMRSRCPDICGDPTHAEVGAALEDFARLVNFCWHCLADEGETPVGSAANLFQQTASRLSSEVARAYEVLDGLSNGLMMLRSFHTSHPGAIPIRLDPVPGPSVAIAADPIPVSIPETPDWFLPHPDPNVGYRRVTIIAADGETRTLRLSRPQSELFELLDQHRKRGVDEGRVCTSTMRNALKISIAYHPCKAVHRDKNPKRKGILKPCAVVDDMTCRLVRPAAFPIG